MAGTWKNLFGTLKNVFQLGIGGVNIKNSSGNLLVRNPADNADAEITASKVKVSGNSLEINSDAAGSGADYKYTLSRPSSGMSADVTLTLPTDDGTNGQVLATDGSGALTWVSAASTDACRKKDSTSLAFGTSSPVSMLTLPANAVLEQLTVIVDTSFDGTPSMSIGISGNTSKYVASTEVDLTAAAETRFDIEPAKTPSGSTEAVIITYSAGGATAGAARVIADYSTPA